MRVRGCTQGFQPQPDNCSTRAPPNHGLHLPAPGRTCGGAANLSPTTPPFMPAYPRLPSHACSPMPSPRTCPSTLPPVPAHPHLPSHACLLHLPTPHATSHTTRQGCPPQQLRAMDTFSSSRGYQAPTNALPPTNSTCRKATGGLLHSGACAWTAVLMAPFVKAQERESLSPEGRLKEVYPSLFVHAEGSSLCTEAERSARWGEGRRESLKCVPLARQALLPAARTPNKTTLTTHHTGAS